MKRIEQSMGKMNISTLLIMVILFYGGFVAFKLIASRITKSQIKNEIVEQFGFIRGPEFTVEKGESIIIEILTAHNLYVEPEEKGSEDSEESDSVDSEDMEKNAERQKIQAGTRILVQIKEKGTRIKFRVDYVDVVNLILFKQASNYTIEEEVINYN